MTNVISLPKTAGEARALIRAGEITGHTVGMAPGYVQTNLAILPKALAFDFLLFCQRNPRPCPLIEVMDAGETEPKQSAPGADIRTDTSKYRIYRDGKVEAEVADISEYWTDDLVTFLLGCSFTFENALLNAGISLRHQEMGVNVPMFITNIETVPAGVFHGPMVVSMRPIAPDKIVKSVQVTSRFPMVHGAPIHIGDPEAIGIKDIMKPDLGDPVDFKPGEVPVFWACGVTPQAVAMKSRPPFMITHSPGHMFLTDLKDEDVSVL